MKKLLKKISYLTISAIVGFSIIATHAHAAIAFDNSVDGGGGSGNLTFGISCSSSANRILFVTDVQFTGSVSAITYNGVAMTKLTSITNAGLGQTINLWYLVAPASGANTISVTASGTHNYSADSYIGVSQTGAIDNFSSNTLTSGTTYTTSITTIANNAWTVATIMATNNLTVGTGTTFRTRANGNNNLEFFDSNGPKTPAGSTSLVVTSTTGTFSSIIVSLAPFVVSPINSNFFF